MKRNWCEIDEVCRTAGELERASVGCRVKKKINNSEKHLLPSRGGCSSAIKRIIIERLNNIVAMSATGTENMEGAESTHNTKISDSGYSNSCSNSQSQRSGSSKSRHSGSNSSGSSGYGGKANIQAGTDAPLQHPPAKRTKDKDRKKKKLKTSVEPPSGGAGEDSFTTVSGATFTTASGEQVQSGGHASAVGQGEAQENQSHVDDTDVPDGGDEPMAKDDAPHVQDSTAGAETTKIHCALPGPSPVACGAAATEENQEPVCEEAVGIQEPAQAGGTTPANAKPDTENPN